MTADRGGLAGGPGACHECPTGMGMTRFGARALVAPFPRGICRGAESQAWQQCSGAREACQVADCCKHGAGYGQLHAAEGLERFDYWLPAPYLHVVVACLCQALASVRLGVHRPAIFLQDEVLRRSWTHDCGAPP